LEGLFIASPLLLEGIDVVPKILGSSFEVASEFHEGGIVSCEKTIADSRAFLCFLFVHATLHVGKNVEFDLFVERSVDGEDMKQVLLVDRGRVLINARMKITLLDEELGKRSYHGIGSIVGLNVCKAVSFVKVGWAGHNVSCVGSETGNQFIVEIANNLIFEKLGVGLLDHEVDVSSPGKRIDCTRRALGGNVPLDLLGLFGASTPLRRFFGRKALKRECIDRWRARERSQPGFDGFKVLFARLSRCFDLEQTLFQYNGSVVDIEVLVAGIEAEHGVIHGDGFFFCSTRLQFLLRYA